MSPMLSRRALVGTMGALAMPRIGQAATLTPASVRMDWALSGYQLPFYWAKQKGYYADEGIDIEIKDGAGSAKAVQLVSAKEDTFGLADSLVTANSIVKGMRVRSVLVVVQDGGSAIVSWADKPMRSPAEMVGRSVAAAADQKSTLDLLLKVNGIPSDKVALRVVSVAARNTVLYQNQVDGIVSSLIGSPMDMVVAAREGKGKPVHIMPFSDFGIRSMSTGVVVHDATVAANPGLVRGFVRASLRALKDITDPAAADEATDIALTLSKAPTGRRESVKLQWLATLPRLQTENSLGKPLGWTSEVDWQAAIDLLLKTEQIATPVAPATLYTNEYIPA